MHILHWYPNLFCGGAVSTVVAELAARQQTLGARVTIVALPLGRAPLYEDVQVDRNADILTWKPRWSISIGERRLHGISRSFARKLRAIKPDVVHIHGEFNLDNLWVPRLFRCPILLSTREGFHPSSVNHGQRLLKRLYLPIARRLLYNHVSLFDALAPAEVQHVEALVPGARVVCIPHGPNPRLSETMEPAPPTGERGADEIRLICVAGLNIHRKGLDNLLHAFAAAKAVLPDKRWSLTLVGPDHSDEQAELMARAKALDIDEEIRFTGGLDFAGVGRELADSDFFVLLSRYEGIGTSTVEALLAGKPVVVSDEVGAACFPEIAAMPHVFRVAQGSAEAATAIVKAAKRLPDLSAAAMAHRQIIREFFSWERSAETLLAFYAELATRPALSDKPASNWEPTDRRLATPTH